jgi:hypothetical protein
LKENLIKGCFLVHFDPNKSFKLMINALDYAVGEILKQKGDDW